MNGLGPRRSNLRKKLFKIDWKCPNCETVSPDVPTYIKDQWCPMCGAEMKRIYAPPIVLFKGGGWTPTFHGKTRIIRDDHRHDDFDKDWNKIANMKCGQPE